MIPVLLHEHEGWHLVVLKIALPHVLQQENTLIRPLSNHYRLPTLCTSSFYPVPVPFMFVSVSVSVSVSVALHQVKPIVIESRSNQNAKSTLVLKTSETIGSHAVTLLPRSHSLCYTMLMTCLHNERRYQNIHPSIKLMRPLARMQDLIGFATIPQLTARSYHVYVTKIPKHPSKINVQPCLCSSLVHLT